MKFLLVLAGLLGLALSQPSSTVWPDHDCMLDHDIVPDDPHKFRMKGSDGWADVSCNPPHLVFNLSSDCKCLWSNRELTYGDCNTVNKPIPGEPNYMYQFWHPVDNVWVTANCHAVFPSTHTHNNDQVYFNVTGCSCDWLPEDERGPLTVNKLADCTLDMDIPMIEQPPLDEMGSFVQPYDPVWKRWPPKVLLELVDQRRAVRFLASRLKSWFLTDNEKPNIRMYFGLKAMSDDDNNNFRCVLADSCARLIRGETIIYPATFRLWYRASNRAFRIEYKNGTWECSPGGSGVGTWSDVAFFYGKYSTGPTLSVDGKDCNLRESIPQDDPDPREDGLTNPGYFRLHFTCELNLGGDPLDPDTKYTGYMSRFREMSGAECTVNGMP